MKNILIALSLFLLTNKSSAITVGDSMFIKKSNFGIYSSIVFLICFLIIFIVSVISTMKKCEFITTCNDMEEKKKLARKNWGLLIIPLAFLVIGSIILMMLFTMATGSTRMPNYINYIFDFLMLAVLINTIIIGIIMELIKRNKLRSNKIVNIIFVLTIALVVILTIVLIIGLLKGDYYNTTHYLG